MKLIQTLPEAYLFQRRGKSFRFPRVSTLLDWEFGPMLGDPENLKWLAKFGRMVHASIDRREPLPGTDGYVKAAWDFMKTIGFRTVEKELVVHSNRWKFAGRLDRVGISKDRIALIDWKTGTFGVRGQLQLNLYDIAHYEMKGLVSGSLYGVELKDGKFKVKKVERNWVKALDVVQRYHKQRGTV